MTIYMDYLLFVNFTVNLLLLYGTAVFGKLSYRGRRLILAAFLGSFLAAILYFLPPFPAFVVKLCGTFVMVYLGFMPKSLRGFLFRTALFLGLSCLFAGAVFGLYFLTGDGRHFQIRNGVYYLQVPAACFLFAAALSYCALWLVGHFWGKQVRVKAGCLKAVIRLREKSVVLTAFLDTGNHLRAPGSGLPVLVAELQKMAGLFPKQLVRALAEKDQSRLLQELERFGELTWCQVPYEVLGGSGVLFAFMPEQVLICRGKEQRAASPCYIAVCPQALSEDYQCLFHSAIQF